MRIAIASGKGGTGKTTVSVNLARTMGLPVQLLDCDVEEPNAHLFLAGNKVKEEMVTIPVPQVDEALCDGCGECSKFCEYSAIITLGKTPLIFPEMLRNGLKASGQTLQYLLNMIFGQVISRRWKKGKFLPYLFLPIGLPAAF